MRQDVRLRLLGSVLLFGCVGEVQSLDEPPAPAAEDAGGSPSATGWTGGGGTGGVNTPQPSTCKAGLDPGPTPLAKLSTVQYRNTVTDLLAVSGVAEVAGEIKDLLSAI